MRNHSYHLLILSLILFSFISCKKDPTKNATLPAATQEGKNTIGFTINSEVWVPYYKCRSFSGDPCGEISARYGSSGGAAPNGIDFGFGRERKSKLSALLISSTGVGTITSIGEKIDSIHVTYLSENSINNDGLFTGALQGSSFNITTFDSVAQILSGTFKFILIEENGSGNTINIENGRFDLKLNACKCSN